MKVQKVTLTLLYDHEYYDTPEFWHWSALIGEDETLCKVLNIETEPERDPTSDECQLPLQLFYSE